MSTIATWALGFGLSYLQKHPALIDGIFAKAEKSIPGKLDDAALELLKKALGF
ncbi:MAG: hypothetical protein ACXVRY_15995 [Gaiellaceae bacterium]